jgi:hypothetical protein
VVVALTASSSAGTTGVAGKAKLRVRVSRKAARSLRRRKSVRVAIAVGFKPAAGGASVRRSGSLMLKR